MKVTRILLQSKRMTIEFDNIDDDEKLSFVFRHRKTKDVVQVEGIQDRANNQITLEYKDVDLPEVEFARYDLLVATGGKLIRPKIENKNLSLKKINFDIFYFTSEHYGFRFYFTRDNEVSISRGNYINVEKEFKQLRQIEVPIEEVKYVGHKLFIKAFFESPSVKTFIAWKDKKENYILHNGAYFQNVESRSLIEIEKEAFMSIINLEEITPIVVFVKDSILYEGVLRSEKLPKDDQIGNQLSIYHYSKNGNLKLTSNLNLFMRKVLNVEKQHCIVKKFSFSEELISIRVNDQVELSNILLFKENVSSKHFMPVTDFTIKGSNIRIPTDQIANDKEQYRYVFLKKDKEKAKSCHDESEGDIPSNYEYFGFFKENYSQKSLKSEKYNDYVVLNENMWLCSYWSVNGELVFRVATPEQYRKKRFEKRNLNFSGTNFVDSFAQIEVQLETTKLDSASELNFYLVERKTKKRLDIDFKIKNSSTVILDFQTFLDELEIVSSRWDTYVDVYQQESHLHGKLGKFSSSVQDKFSRYLSSISGEPNENNFCLVPYFSVKNELAFIWNDIDKIHNEQLEHNIKVTANKVNSSGIEITSKVSKIGVSDFKVSSGMIKLRNKAVFMEYEIPIEVISKSNNEVSVKLKIIPDKYHLLPFFWDVFVVLQVGKEKFPLRVKNPSKSVKRKIMKQIDRNEIDLLDNYMIYPYITSDNSYALCYRERKNYENKVNRFKENVAYFTYRLFRKYFDRKKVWIGYEKEASVAQDNGYQFFNYCYTNNKKKDYYFVIKTNSVDYRDIEHQKDKILKFMSFKYMVYMFAAELMISSESKGHSYDIRIQKGHLRNALQKKRFVFLQHGVTALKRVDYVFSKSKNNAVSLYTATSDFEKDIIKNNFGYDDSEIMLTGFTRWDVLEDKSKEEEKKIFVMPTWRSWMDGIPEEEFIESDYYKQYRKLLESRELNEILEKNDITLHFLLHPKFIAYSDKFTIPGERIQTHQFGEIKINEMLMESNLLITDYSSVSWEFFYMKKPVLFFQFDQNDYNRYQGSYIDLETGLFGDSAANVDELLKYIQYYVDNNFSEKSKYGVLRNKYFKYVDHNNSKRTFDAISKFEKKINND